MCFMLQELRALQLKNSDLTRQARMAQEHAHRERVDARVRVDEARLELQRLDDEMRHVKQAHARDMQEVRVTSSAAVHSE